MIRNIFYCKDNLKCETFESYRLKRREELMNAKHEVEIIKEPEENLCNLISKPLLNRPKIVTFKETCRKSNILPKIDKEKKKCPKEKQESFSNEHFETPSPHFEGYINKNITNVVLSVPRAPTKCFVDDRHGNKQTKSPVQSNKKVNCPQGRKINILNQIKDKKYVAMEENNEEVADNMIMIDKDTICSLLENLRQKWQLLYRELVLMPFSLPIEKKKIRSAQIEQELSEVEKLIDLLEKHDVIYVNND
jgi:hypothetical protein